MTSQQFKNLESEYQELGARLIFLTKDIIVDDDDDNPREDDSDLTTNMKSLDLTRQSIINRSTIADFF